MPSPILSRLVTLRALQEEAATVPYPTVESYLQYVRNRSIVTFKRIDEPQVSIP